MSTGTARRGPATSAEEAGVVTALARGLDILRCFDRPNLQLTVSEISRRVGLSQPTTWRLCHTLLEKGFLARCPGSTALRVGLPVLTLGFAAIKGVSVPALAANYLQEFTDDFGCSTSLSVRQNNEMISIDSRHGVFLEPNHPTGWRASLSSSASGLAVLAILPDEDRLTTLRSIEARDPGAWPRRCERIESAREQYLAEGTVTFDGMYGAHYTSVAVPLVENLGDAATYWAISCGGLSTHWNDELIQRVAAALRKMRNLLQPALSMAA